MLPMWGSASSYPSQPRVYAAAVFHANLNQAAHCSMRTFRFNYIAEPTLKRFHASNDFVRGVMGPVGSGKSSAMCAEIVIRACAQAPDNQNRRRSRFAVIRNTYPELKSTTLKTWRDWVPQSLCNVSGTGPLSASLVTGLEDGTTVDAEIIFLALDMTRDVKKLLSLELTGAWINEAREVPRDILDALTARVGRFPPKRLGGCGWSGVFMDTNPPDDDHWWYALAEEQKPEGWSFFRQPPALVETTGGFEPNPLAENVGNLPHGARYWLRQIPGKTRDWIDVYILGRYGSLRSGRPVYPEYDDARHLAQEPLEPIPGLPLILGWDFGLTPACVLTQVSPRGSLLVIEELASTDMGIRQFARQVVAPRLKTAYPRFAVRGVADPAGRARAQTDERTCMDELAAAGLAADPARTNDFIARREAVAGFLNAGEPDAPGLVLSPNCRLLRKGFLSGYRYERVQVTGDERYKDAPVKNMHSHIHDALQYAALAAESAAWRSRPRKRRAYPGHGDPRSGY